jgi:hypothetical protein
MLEPVTHIIERPMFTMGQLQASPGMYKARLYLPTWAPDPAPIVRAYIFNQGRYESSNAGHPLWGDASLAIDAASQYANAANYPDVEEASPSGLESLIYTDMIDRVTSRLADSGRLPLALSPTGVPQGLPTYSNSRGDCLIWAIEGDGTSDVLFYFFLGLTWLEEGGRHCPPGPEVRLLVSGEPSPQGIIRDNSFLNHQLVLGGVPPHVVASFPAIPAVPTATGVVQFDGVGHIRVTDQLTSFIWPGDFSMSAWVRTSVVGYDNSIRRTLYCAGPGGIADADRTGAWGFDMSGRMFWGNQKVGPLVLGNTVVTDGTWRKVGVRRVAGQLALLLGDVADSTTITDTTSYNVDTSNTSVGVALGANSYSNFLGGHYSGLLRDLTVTKPL